MTVKVTGQWGQKLYVLYKIINASIVTGEKNINNSYSNAYYRSALRLGNFILIRPFLAYPAHRSGYAKWVEGNYHFCIRGFHTNNIKAIKRIGPHNEDVISVIIGSLLVDGSVNKKTINGVRFCYSLFPRQGRPCRGNKYWSYLIFLFNFFNERGYTKRNSIHTIGPSKDSKKSGYGFETFTFRSFNWISNMFLKKGKLYLNFKIEKYITPLSLLIWISGRGKFFNELHIGTCFRTIQNVETLRDILMRKYKIKCKIYEYNKSHFDIIISNSSFNNLINLINLSTVRPWINLMVDPYINKDLLDKKQKNQNLKNNKSYELIKDTYLIYSLLNLITHPVNKGKHIYFPYYISLTGGLLSETPWWLPIRAAIGYIKKINNFNSRWQKFYSTLNENNLGIINNINPRALRQGGPGPENVIKNSDSPAAVPAGESTWGNENNTLNEKLHPSYVTGFADGESSFHLAISKSNMYKKGWYIRACFSITLSKVDLDLLEKIKTFFSAGNIYQKSDINTVRYSVDSLKQITNIIIPHFNKYHLITQKRSDFELFKLAVEIMTNKENNNIEGVKKLIAIRASMNRGLPEKLKLEFPDVNPQIRPVFELPDILDSNWIAGFADAEGSFYVSIKNSNTTKTGKSLWLNFIIGLHIRDSSVLMKLQEQLGCGKIWKNTKFCYFMVRKLKDILTIIIPLFNHNSLHGSKNLNFIDFCEIASMLKNKEHLTNEGLEKIKKIKNGMNTKRFSPLISKEELSNHDINWYF